jgi:hypothetical protein
MRELTLTVNESLFHRLQRSVLRDGMTLNTAILEGIKAYIEGEESAFNADADDDNGFEAGPLISGLN